MVRFDDSRFAGWLGSWLGAGDRSFRGRLIAAVALVGIPVSWGSALFNLALGSPTWTVLLNVIAGFAIVALMLFARRTGRFQLAYLIAVVGIFLVLFPALFFADGGYHSGMPIFFMFAIAFSAIILEGRALWILVPLEAAVFTGCLAVAYLQPQLVTPLGSEAAFLSDVVFTMISAGIALVVALRLLIGLHEQNQQQLKVQNEALAHVDRARAEFLAQVAHELNTPLTVIRAHAQEAGSDLIRDPEQVGRDVAVIEAEADRLGRLVSQLLDLARINEGRLVLELAPQDLDEVIQQTLQAYRPLWTQHGNTLTVARDSDSPIVLADRERVIQVLVNLISNASRHTDHGTITVSVGRVDGRARVCVTDTGSGIAPDRLATLGEGPVRDRPDGLRSARDTGLGVGLVISRHIVTAHSGELTFSSVMGQGTTACFTLPLAEPAADQV